MTEPVMYTLEAPGALLRYGVGQSEPAGTVSTIGSPPHVGDALTPVVSAPVAESAVAPDMVAPDNRRMNANNDALPRNCLRIENRP